MLDLSARGVVNTGNSYVFRGTSRLYDPSATDPATPTPSDGDLYYNTSIKHLMYYDGLRSKWLSVATETFQFGRNGNTAPGSYYRLLDRQAMTSTRGVTAQFNGTVTDLSYTRDDTDTATFQINDDGANLATLISSATSGYSNTLNANFAQGSVLSVLNASGGNTTSYVQGKVTLRWRA